MKIQTCVAMLLLCGIAPVSLSAQRPAGALVPFQGVQLQGGYPTLSPDSAWKLVVVLSGWRDQQIFDAAVRIIEDRAAPELLRAAGVVILAAQAGNDLVYYSGDEPLSGPALLTTTLDPGKLCGPDIGFLQQQDGPVPLDPDHERGAAEVLDPVAVDSSESVLIRRLAGCARAYAPDVPPQIDVSGVQLQYQCGNRYLVINPAERALPMTFAILQTEERVTFVVEAHSERSLLPDGVGTLVLYYDGNLLAQAMSTNTPCLP